MAATIDPSWHALSPEEAMQRLDARADGLSESEAAERRGTFGANAPPKTRRDALIGVILRQFASPLIYILAFAALVSALLGHWNDFGFIAVVIFANASIGAILEWGAESSAEALRKKVRLVTTVVRAGRRREIDAEELVPGDIVLLQSGAAVPADLRLISAQDLRADESLLTGEASATRKDASGSVAADAPVADRPTVLYAGTMIVRGRCVGVVCATGARTQLGAIAALLVGRGGEAPLLLRLRAFTNRLAVVTLAVVFILALAQVARGDPLFDILLFTIALAVSAIPEGLPIAITASLGVASTRMGKRGVIVRRLPAVEALGSCTLIATDKTGTLTANRLTIKRLELPDGSAFDIGGEGLELEGAVQPVDGASSADAEITALAQAAALSNEAELHREDGAVEAQGDAVDVAFLVLAAKLGLKSGDINSRWPQRASLDYEPRRGYSASLNEREDHAVVSVKGAPEIVLPMCANGGGTNRLCIAWLRKDFACWRLPKASSPPITVSRATRCLASVCWALRG